MKKGSDKVGGIRRGIPPQYIKAVKAGVLEAMATGVFFTWEESAYAEKEIGGRKTSRKKKSL